MTTTTTTIRAEQFGREHIGETVSFVVLADSIEPATITGTLRWVTHNADNVQVGVEDHLYDMGAEEWELTLGQEVTLR